MNADHVTTTDTNIYASKHDVTFMERCSNGVMGVQILSSDDSAGQSVHETCDISENYLCKTSLSTLIRFYPLHIPIDSLGSLSH